MNDEQRARLTDAELRSLFGGLFPHGFAGADVLVEIAPDGWERSPLLTCFHPSPGQVFKEQLQIHRNIEAMGRADLKPIYSMIFRRLRALGADWEYHSPSLGVVDLSPLRREFETPGEPIHAIGGGGDHCRARRRVSHGLLSRIT